MKHIFVDVGSFVVWAAFIAPPAHMYDALLDNGVFNVFATRYGNKYCGVYPISKSGRSMLRSIIHRVQKQGMAVQGRTLPFHNWTWNGPSHVSSVTDLNLQRRILASKIVPNTVHWVTLVNWAVGISHATFTSVKWLCRPLDAIYGR